MLKFVLEIVWGFLTYTSKRLEKDLSGGKMYLNLQKKKFKENYGKI
jgi:hypothetical protein